MFPYEQMTRGSEEAASLDLAGRPEVHDVSKSYRTPKGTVHALDHVTLDVEAGEFVGLVGASGRGKSTLFDM